ncbi:hypothetical protein SH501x_004539 [Pirellulaceae bacterium SH501]
MSSIRGENEPQQSALFPVNQVKQIILYSETSVSSQWQKTI